MKEKTYTVKQLAELAGITVRTLHHYDRIGLLRPAGRTEKAYRRYGREELLRLQQILFYKELGFPLSEIKAVLEDPLFDLIKALESHKQALSLESERIGQLLQTIDKTISNLKNNTSMKDEEMYEGLKPEEREARRKEVVDRWGADALRESEDRVRKMGKQGLAKVKAEGEAISKRLAGMMNLHPAERQVQLVIAQHYEHLQQFTPIDKERYRGLGKMYTEDDRFRAHYDVHAQGLADFLYRGIQVFCDNDLKIM